ncbi:hypothetical protein BD777DRAFT_125366 [Yarrowia lipolytica]|nr:hypothetical protein BD777DRAFT_125366 [Yarrowia lipolytica]
MKITNASGSIHLPRTTETYAKKLAEDGLGTIALVSFQGEFTGERRYLEKPYSTVLVRSNCRD